MKTYSFPYDYKSVDVSIDERFVQGVLVSNAAAYVAEKSPAELVEEALDHPINSLPLENWLRENAIWLSLRVTIQRPYAK